MHCCEKCHLYSCSPYHKMLCHHGHSDVDVVTYEDGEWWLFHFENIAVAPAYQKCRAIIGPMRNVLKDDGRILDLLRSVDSWESEETLQRELAKSERIKLDFESTERAKQDVINDTAKVLTKNDGLMERVARNGPGELDPLNIIKHVQKEAPWQLRGFEFKAEEA